jgi:O-antigen/teichoic acid export membrane protein
MSDRPPDAPPHADASEVTQAPASSLWRSGLHTLGMSLASVMLGFGQSVLIARALGDPSIKGGYDLTMASANLIALVLGFSLPVGATYAVAQRRVDPGALAVRLLTWSIAQGLVTAVVILALRDSGVGSALAPAVLGPAVIAPLALLVISYGAVANLRSILIGKHRVVTANNADLMGRIVVPAAMIGAVLASLVLGSRYLTLAFLWCVLLGLVITAARFIWLLRTDIRERAGDAGMRVVLAFSMPAYLSNLIQFLNYRLDLFLVSAMIGLHAVGIYALAVAVAQLLWLVAQAAALVLLPRVAADAGDPHRSSLRSAQVGRLTLYITVAGALVLAVFGRLLVPAIYGERFRESIDPLLLLLPGIATFSLGTVLAAHVAGSGRPSLNLLASSAGLSVTLALDLTLIPAMGVRGAAIASSASYLTSAILTVGVFSRLTGLSPLRLILPAREDLGLVRRLAARFRSH